MALLSGEVETRWEGADTLRPTCSGWLCYPGKLRREVRQADPGRAGRFRMALLSGEVETLIGKPQGGGGGSWFRMALLSGEVETAQVRAAGRLLVRFRMALLSGEVETL